MNLSKEMKRTRNLMMLFGGLVIFFTGFPHVWSIYQPYLMERAGWTQSQTSGCFYLVLAVFVIGNIVGGRLQDKLGYKAVIVIGGGLLSGGILLSAIVITPSPIPMYLTYGVMQGLGQGMIYGTILQIAQRWFPTRMGFASGIVVTANGIFGFFMTPVSKYLLLNHGPKAAFLAIGTAVTITWILSCFFIREPQKEESLNIMSVKKNVLIRQKQYTVREMLKCTEFYYLFIVMLCGLTAYFIMSPISQLLQTSRGISSEVAMWSVMLGSVMNASMRLLLPSFADRIGRIRCLSYVLIVSILAMILLAVSQGFLTTVAVVIMYGCYGGIMGNFPSITSQMFGVEHTGENYGYLMISIIGATFLAQTINNTLSVIYSDRIAFVAGALLVMIALAGTILLNRSRVSNKKLGNVNYMEQ